MKDIHKLGNLAQVRALADPLRLRLLEALRAKPMTTKQVALLIGEKPTRLYHHMEALERAGLVRLVKTRRNRGTVEKYYSPIAEQIIVDRQLLEAGKGTRKATRGYEGLLLGALEATLDEARRSVAAGLIQPLDAGRNALISRQQFSCTEAQLRQLTDRIRGWIEECQSCEPVPGEQLYNLTVAFYPVKGKRAAAVRPLDSDKQSARARRRKKGSG